ncbi:hypothetical protein NDU88_000101 [Pleurodeles waltl]|uniref:Uncharacterized protein n=1 Tax=Pleurodeles waltl TaxID=8319 RepID=A0AAV7NBS5_PLEWA|nr:hypothetical protein NDU88_000101 [Pleurodeles waltl]
MACEAANPEKCRPVTSPKPCTARPARLGFHGPRRSFQEKHVPPGRACLGRILGGTRVQGRHAGATPGAQVVELPSWQDQRRF